MANGRNRDYVMVSLAVSSVPLAFVLYFIAVDRRWSAIIAFIVFLIVLVLFTCAFLSWKTIKLTIPVLLSGLRGCAYIVSPIASLVQGIPLVGKAVNGVIKVTFWVWFVILMMSDVLLRKFLKGFVGLHEPSAGQYSTVNSCDTNFQPCGEFGKVIDQHKVQRIEDGGQDFERDHDERAIALMNQKSKDLAALRDGHHPEDAATTTTASHYHHPSHHHRRSAMALKPRPQSMDYSKYRTPGRAGSDLSSMSSEEWMALLQSADIDASRFADTGVAAAGVGAGSGFRPRLENRHQRQSSMSSNASSSLGSMVLEHEASAANQPRKAASRPPRYSQPIATTLAMVSKLVYEDVPIIRHELELSGYDLHTFRAIAYKNTRGFIIQKGRNIILVFRGTDPLNLQNAWTDLQARLVAIQTKEETPVSLGKCHQGIYNALGTDDFLLPSEELAQQYPEWASSPLAAASMSNGYFHHDQNALQRHPSDLSIATSPHLASLSPVSSFRSEGSRSSGTIHLELSNHSIYHTISTSLRAAYTLIKFLLSGLFTHVSDPVDHRFAGEVRDLGAFGQASRWVDGLRLEHVAKAHQQNGSRRGSMSRLSDVYTENGHLDDLENVDGGSNARYHHRRRRSSSMSGLPVSTRSRQEIGSRRGIEDALQDYQRNYGAQVGKKKKQKKLRFFIAGHSLGGGLATLFVAKLVQTKSPLLNIFSGLYTYGSPKIGDRDFSRAFGYSVACKMFHHVHNNDIISRLPFWGSYATPPGTLVFIDTSRKLSLYPPDPDTLMPVPVRGISFLHLSGILNFQVIMRMRRESWLRVLERFLLPFFMNDHFPSDYVKALAEGKVEVVLEDTARFGGIDEKETGSPLQTGYFSLLSGGRKDAAPPLSPSIPVPPSAQRSILKASIPASTGSTGTTGRVGLSTRDLNKDLDSDSGIGGDMLEDHGAARRRRIIKYSYPSSSLADMDNGVAITPNVKDRKRRSNPGSKEGDFQWRPLADDDLDNYGFGASSSSSVRDRHSPKQHRRRSRSSSRSRLGSSNPVHRTGSSSSMVNLDGMVTVTTTTTTTTTTTRSSNSSQFYVSSSATRRRSRSRHRSGVAPSVGTMSYY